MDQNVHALALGKVVGSLHSLEFILRVFLAKTSGDERGAGRSLRRAKVGDSVPEDAFTNYDSLGQLIEKYNALVADPDLSVSEDVVDVRDALAHGRVSGESPNFPLQLLKFERPRDGRVRITHSFPMTAEWFAQQTRHITAQIQKVHTALDQLG